MPDPTPSLTLHRRDDGIAELVFDRAGSAANIFDMPALDELDRHLETIENDASLRGLIVRSAKPAIFIAGADIKSLARETGDALEAFIGKGQRVFQRLADLKIPTAAAIHGACLGGGFEIALACDWRVASLSDATRIGLPETMLGILPAWGGSTRLPRLIGLPKALDLILAGKQVPPKLAKKLGLVDGLAPVERIVDLATGLLGKGKAVRKTPWLTNNPVSAAVIRAAAGRKIRAQTRGHYPAQLAALNVVSRAGSGPLAESLGREREEVLKLARTDAAKNLIRIFLLQENAKKTRPHPTAEARKVGRTAVIGAGVMGAGIAQWLAARGLPVVLRDLDDARLGAGMATIGKLFREGVKRRVFTPVEAMRASDLISPSAAPVPMDRVDLVIEAAVENLEIKKKIFADLSSRVSPETVLATNTSALPIGEIGHGDGVTHPERLVGVHFFNPVHRMKLVEIVVTEATSPGTIETALAFVRAIGKLPVVVKDSPGFVVNRILMPYLIEAGRLFERGVDPVAIDEAMLDFGMPMGPLRLLDEVGLDVASHVAATMGAAFGDRFAMPAVLAKLVEKGHLGRKSGRGFFEHRGKKTAPNAEALALRGEAAGDAPDRPAIAERLALLMANESFRVLEEGVAASADDIDFAMILGTGFAPFRGGPVTWANTVGLPVVREKLAALGETEGELFAPSKLLNGAADLGDLKKS
ncbi:MAG: enoyl-CoA hydratase/isomerase family protein [Akkermansiaceae bacterium]|nr:enoyl-CoA hydratase/isomerase family protein [Akkermansiaceae bacterium]MCP5550023.1 enoyl-CoA hydratase/isomerase family protein [Akkermansiaceae bacterium]